METRFVEATDTHRGLYGKFMLARWTHEEWDRRAQMDGTLGQRLLASRGHDPREFWVVDLETNEGAFFSMNKHGLAASDLMKRRIWVCPLFEGFLQHLYSLDDPWAVEPLVTISHVTDSYRRPGPNDEPQRTASVQAPRREA